MLKKKPLVANAIPNQPLKAGAGLLVKGGQTHGTDGRIYRVSGRSKREQVLIDESGFCSVMESPKLIKGSA